MGSLRVLLAISVLCAHAGGFYGLYIFDGTLAVQAFYLISGFYMTLVITEKYKSPKGYAWLKVFWLSRYFRLVPAYLFISLLALMFRITQDKLGVYKDANLSSILLAFFSHVTLIGQDLFVFTGYDTVTHTFKWMPDVFTGGLKRAGVNYVNGLEFLLIPQGWSIGVEVWFYLLAPFIVTRRLPIVLLMIGGSLCLRLYIHFVLGWKDAGLWYYRFFPNELGIFLLGTLSYKAYKFLEKFVSFQSLAKGIYGAFLLIVIFYNCGFGQSSIKNALFLGVLSASLPFIFIVTKDSKLDRFIGEFSYPIYLSHILILAMIPHSLRGHGIYCLVLTIIFSVFVVFCIDGPVDNWRHRKLRSKKR